MTTDRGWMDRRAFLQGLLALGALLASDPAAAGTPSSTFHRIYGDPKLREQFYPFLYTVFHLYPEQDFHQLILQATERHDTDEAIYRALLQDLPRIKPMLADLTYALPALRKQKAEMTRQSAALLGDERVDGYLEIGTPGRYVASLRAALDLQGPVFLLHDRAPGYGPVDLLERGGLRQAGTYLPLGDYQPIPSSEIPDASLDLVTCFIGFHHCPLPALDGFIDGVRRVLRPGGKLLLREHDVHSAQMDDLVALAHDVFNAGTMADWEVNAQEYRRFRSVQDWLSLLTARGFRHEGEGLTQDGDPTANTLLRLARV